jgi:phosphatidylglycerol:prolipoprotein diacylglycerol transferase
MSQGFTLFGNLTVHYYGIIIMSGAILAAFLAARQSKLKGLDPEVIWDLLPWLLVAGIIGARLWHIFTPPASSLINGKNPYLIYPLEALKIWKGGLGIPGAVMGGALALHIYCRVKKLKFGQWVDVIAPGLALAQAIGRWGNFVNQEVYGLPSNLPWAITIDPAHRLPGYENISRYQPTFLYESIWNLLNMGLLLLLSKKYKDKFKDGDIFLVYLMFYAVGRFTLEFIRIDYSPIAGININQTLMAVVFVFAAALFTIHRFVKTPVVEETESTESVEAIEKTETSDLVDTNGPKIARTPRKTKEPTVVDEPTGATTPKVKRAAKKPKATDETLEQK